VIEHHRIDPRQFRGDERPAKKRSRRTASTGLRLWVLAAARRSASIARSSPSAATTRLRSAKPQRERPDAGEQVGHRRRGSSIGEHEAREGVFAAYRRLQEGAGR
jgi:hypothetical protein